MASPEFLFTRNPNLEDSWPFVHQRMVRRLGELGPTQVLETDAQTHVHQQVDLSATIGISHLGRNLTDACIDHAPKLRMVGALTDNSGHGIPYTGPAGTRDSGHRFDQGMVPIGGGVRLRSRPVGAAPHRPVAYEDGQRCIAVGLEEPDMGKGQAPGCGPVLRRSGLRQRRPGDQAHRCGRPGPDRRDELAGAFDVYDVEPVPVDDELRNRDNVVHTPHIAGRTKDANIRVADVIADDFARML